MGKKQAVVVSYYRWWQSRQHFFADWMESNGYYTNYLSADYDHIQKKYIDGEIIPEYTIKLHVPSYKKNVSFARIWSNYIFDKKVYAYLKKYKPEVVICLIPSNFLGVALCKYKKINPDTKIIVDVMDLWPESLPINHFIKNLLTIPFEIWKIFRRKAFKVASLITFECSLFEERVKKDIDISKSRVLYLQKSNGYVHSKKTIKDEICFAYTGSINNIVDIDRITRILKAINKHRKVSVKIIGCGSNEDKFVNSLEKARIKVVFYGPIFDDNKKHSIYAKCHFGINIMKESVAVGLTTKSMDYLEAGMPLLNSIPFDTSYLIEKYNAGFDLNRWSEEEVIKALINMSPSEYSLMTKGADELFYNEFSTDVFNKKLCSYLEETIN